MVGHEIRKNDGCRARHPCEAVHQHLSSFTDSQVNEVAGLAEVGTQTDARVVEDLDYLVSELTWEFRRKTVTDCQYVSDFPELERRSSVGSANRAQI